MTNRQLIAVLQQLPQDDDTSLLILQPDLQSGNGLWGQSVGIHLLTKEQADRCTEDFPIGHLCVVLP